MWKEPKIIYTESDLIQCDVKVTGDHDFDGFGLLKVTHTNQLLTDFKTYSFNHLTIQDCLYVQFTFPYSPNKNNFIY